MPNFVKTGAGFIAGQHYEDGAPVTLTAAQAKYLAPPYGDAVAPAPGSDPAPAADEPRSRGRKPRE